MPNNLARHITKDFDHNPVFQFLGFFLEDDLRYLLAFPLVYSVSRSSNNFELDSEECQLDCIAGYDIRIDARYVVQELDEDVEAIFARISRGSQVGSLVAANLYHGAFKTPSELITPGDSSCSQDGI